MVGPAGFEPSGSRSLQELMRLDLASLGRFSLVERKFANHLHRFEPQVGNGFHYAKDDIIIDIRSI
jgi:hypothetical protein